MPPSAPIFETRMARTDDDVRGAQTLRYSVFVEELGAQGDMVDHDARLERDRFDEHANQLLLLDRSRTKGDHIVGVYRIIDEDARQNAGAFYSSYEYDLTALEDSGRPILELGRSCLHKDYRGGAAMLHLWQGLADVVRQTRAEILFGVASFQGIDLDILAQPLSLLARDHSAPDDLTARSHVYQPMNLVQDLDRVSAMKQVPSLIKAYLRLGGCVGDGAFVDHAFNTTDVCLILDVAQMNPRQAAIYGGQAR